MLIAADETSGTSFVRKGPFSHWSKYQIYIQKGKTPEGIRWLFFATNPGLNASAKLLLVRNDGFQHNYLTNEQLSNRNLQNMTCQCLLVQKMVLDQLIYTMDDEFTDWPVEVRSAIHNVSSSHQAFRKSLD